MIDGHNRYAICTKYGIPFQTKEMVFNSKTHAEIWIIRTQKGRRNASTYVMVGLGLKLEDLLNQKGLENKVTKAHSFENLSKNEPLLKQNSAKASDNIENNWTKHNFVETRKEIANFANTSHDTVAKVRGNKKRYTC